MPASKKCSKCNSKKPIEAFYLRKTGIRAGQYYDRCIECYKNRGREYYHVNKARQLELALKRRHRRIADLRKFVNEQKRDKSCMDCEGTFPSYVMDFDHRDSTSKINNIGKIGSKGLYTVKQVIDEIKKCDLVCANCHRIRTFTRIAAIVDKKLP